MLVPSYRPESKIGQPGHLSLILIYYGRFTVCYWPLILTDAPLSLIYEPLYFIKSEWLIGSHSAAVSEQHRPSGTTSGAGLPAGWWCQCTWHQPGLRLKKDYGCWVLRPAISHTKTECTDSWGQIVHTINLTFILYYSVALFFFSLTATICVIGCKVCHVLMRMMCPHLCLLLAWCVQAHSTSCLRFIFISCCTCDVYSQYNPPQLLLGAVPVCGSCHKLAFPKKYTVFV